MTIEVEYQRALYTLLNTNKAALGLEAIHDFPPQVADGGSIAGFPYATIGTIFPVMMDTQTTTGFEITHRIHVWSRTKSMLQCKTIQGALYALLHRQTLTVTGFSNFLTLRNDTFCEREPDQKVHGVCEYRALVESA